MCESFKYYLFGFNSIQAAIDTAIVHFKYGDYYGWRIPNLMFGTFPQPTVLLIPDNNLRWIITFLSLSFLPYFTVIPPIIALEKERNIKELMVVMGLMNHAYWFGCLFIEVVISVFHCAIITVAFVIMKLTMHINPIYFYILLQLYAISLILISFLITVPFKSTKVP